MSRTTGLIIFAATLAVGAILFFPANAPATKPARNQKSPASSAPVPAALGDVRMTGELAARLNANYTRLEDDRYRPPRLFDEPNDGWPGDLEGRTMLGLTLLAQVTGREPKYLDAILDTYSGRVNERGYLGPVLDPESISEQALGGQFWDVRALLEYGEWKNDARAGELADKLVRNFYLPVAGAYRSYPIDPVSRESDGSTFGSEVRKIGRWRLSSDIGCGFGGLDALTDFYARHPDPAVAALIDEIIARFREEDPERVQAQMHSTLTTTRSVLRQYETTGRGDLLRTARERYRLYRTRAMTDTFENHNWFGKPWWTEPCAVIDSYILAVQLWRFTGEPEYLEDAHHSYYNGIGAEQRANGGFGCNTCASADTPFVAVHIPEAYWCCTGRGAEGLARAAQYCFFTDADGLSLPFYQNAEATVRWGTESLTVRETTGYPWEGRVQLEITGASGNRERPIRLFIPSWAEKPSARVNGVTVNAPVRAGFLTVSRAWKRGDTVEMTFSQRVVARPPVNAVNGVEKRKYHTFHYGPLILAADGPESISLDANTRFSRRGEREFAANGQDVILRPLYHLPEMGMDRTDGFRRQVLFFEKK